MKRYYSASTGGFYAEELHGDNIPADAVEITAERHGALLQAQSEGKLIQADAEGLPVAVTPPGPTPAELRSRLQGEINSRKNALRDGGFMVDGTLFDSDASARLAYAELAQRLTAEPTFSTEWKASASAWVTMNAPLFAKVYAAGAQHIARAFAWQRAEEERLAATPDAGLASFTVGEVPHA